KLHKQKDFKNAISYYERVVNEPLAKENLISFAKVYLNQAKSNQTIKTPEIYYEQITKAKSVTTAWDLAQEMKKNFSNLELTKLAMNKAAELNLNYGMKLHKHCKIKNPDSYYSRISKEKNTSELLN